MSRTIHVQLAPDSSLADRIGVAGEPHSKTVSAFADPNRNPVGTATKDESAAQRIVQAGRYAWSLLHNYRGNDPQWFELWLHFVPRGCSCKEDFTKILSEYPPDYTDADSFWRWGWFIHNLVNEKLGKPVLSLDEARHQWVTPKEQ